MDFWMFCLFGYVLIIPNNCGADFGMKNSDSYGPYIVEYGECSVCRGPKATNGTTYTINLLRETNGYYTYTINITFPQITIIDEIRMKVYTVKNGKKTILWTVNANKPCSHYMLGAMLETYFGVKNCVLKKGNVYIALPLTELLLKYTGDSFFYGDYFFKVVVTSKKENLACLLFDPMIRKKNTKT